MRGGDIIMISIEEDGAPVNFFFPSNFSACSNVQFEVEGTFESGILAAAWNPDESVVAIVTGNQKFSVSCLSNLSYLLQVTTNSFF